MLNKLSRHNLRIFITGFCMGLADLVPGISGGTIALLGGVYYRFMKAIGSIDLSLLPLLWKGQWRLFWQRVDGGFLCLLLGGIAVAAISASKLIHYLLEHQGIAMGSLFLGLILTATFGLINTLRDKQAFRWDFFILGVLLSVSIGLLPNATGMQTVDGWQYLLVFGAGFVAISAMVLPGVSGSFILLMLGVYPLIIASIANSNLPILGAFLAGCGIGILLACRVIAWLLRDYLAVTMSLLTGLMLGSTNALWPWKQTLVYRMDSAGKAVPIVEENLLPNVYTSLTGQDHQIVLASIVFAVAVILVWKFGRVNLDDLD